MMKIPNCCTLQEQYYILKTFFDEININEAHRITQHEFAEHNYKPVELFHVFFHMT